MKIFIDGFGVVAHSIIRKLLANHSIRKSDILVNTYDSQENFIFQKYLEKEGIRFLFGNYDVIFDEIYRFQPDYFFRYTGEELYPEKFSNL